MKNLHPVTTFFLDLFFPKKCLLCGHIGKYFCDCCKNKLPHNEQLICPGCLNPSLSGITHAFCHKKTPIDQVFFPFKYEGAIKKAIKKIKYQGVFAITEDLVAITAERVDQTLFTDMLLVPVPLHQKRYKTRGFNQAELIAKHLSQLWHIPYDATVLKRVRNTRPQVELKKKDRQSNIKGAFEVCDSKKVKDRKIVLVDDVFTTGATLTECARVLKKKKASTIWVFTIAHGN